MARLSAFGGAADVAGHAALFKAYGVAAFLPRPHTHVQFLPTLVGFESKNGLLY